MKLWVWAVSLNCGHRLPLGPLGACAPNESGRPRGIRHFGQGSIKLALGDVMDRYGVLPLDGFESMRTTDLWVHLRLGPAGAREYYYFGALRAHTGTLAETLFRYDQERGKPLSDPHETVFNWIGLWESIQGTPGFDWQLKV